MAGRRDFSTVPVRIFGDPRPSALDFRTLACVSMHDGMSLKKGTGRGCYATFATLTASLGCDASNLSKSLKRLVEWGYLSEERQEDRRRRTYRVVFDAPESWRNDQQSPPQALRPTPAEKVGELANNPSEIVGNGECRNGSYPPQDDQHYSSLKGLDLSEEKLDSSEEARFAARVLHEFGIGGEKSRLKAGPSKLAFAENVGAQLAALERALKAGEQIDLVERYQFVGTAWEIEEHRHRAERLSEELSARMTPEEYERCCF